LRSNINVKWVNVRDITGEIFDCFCCVQAVKHIENIYNYCAKNVATKALVSIAPS